MKGGPRLRTRNPDPNALNRNRKSDQASWTTLPSTGVSVIPEWPKEIEERPTSNEMSLWKRLWRDYPQAHLWLEHRMEIAVATYVRTALIVADGGVGAPMLNSARIQSETLLLTPQALRTARYRLVSDGEEPQEDAGEPGDVVPIVPRRPVGVRDRMRVAEPKSGAAE